MRVYPELNNKTNSMLPQEKQKMKDAVTHKVAVYFVLAIIIFFFFKMLLP
jgi:hypothetical protein